MGRGGQDATKYAINTFPNVMMMEMSPGTLSAVPMGGKMSPNGSYIQDQATRQVCPRKLDMTTMATHVDSHTLPAPLLNPRAHK